MIPRIDEVDANDIASTEFDIGLWAAGFEARAAWLVNSEYKPRNCRDWYRVEFSEHREAHSAVSNRAPAFGTLLGGHHAGVTDDGHWALVWRQLIAAAHERFGRPLRLFVDYSSMPRTVYGTLLIECMRRARPLIESITMAYVPGDHGSQIEGSRTVEGLRGLVGTEGTSNRAASSAFIIGLGYDGVLAEAIVDLFQVSHYSVFYGDPGVLQNSVQRVLEANNELIQGCDIAEPAPAHSISAAMYTVMKLHHWYAGRRDVLVVPLGPKPHVVGALLAAAIDTTIGFRFPSGKIMTPVEVTVRPGTKPFVSRIAFSDNETREV